MAKKKVADEAEKSLEWLLDRYKHRCDNQKYNIGDEVHTPMYRCKGGIILECLYKTFYKVEFTYPESVKYSNDKRDVTRIKWFSCYDLYPIGNKKHNFTRANSWKDQLWISSNKKELEFFIRMYTDGHLDLNPKYQRDLVWTLKQKQSLIESIFELKNTGSLTLIRDENYNYEILDGKQRLSTVFDFMMDKFKYKGVLFSELDRMDRSTIESHSFQYSQIEANTDLTTEEKVELFIDFNTR